MQTISLGQKSSTIKEICGHFVKADGSYVGLLVKLAKNRYVIVGLKNWASTVEWVSGEFRATDFMKQGFCPAHRVNCYTAA